MPDLSDTIRRGRALADRADRPDLSRRLEQTDARLHGGGVRVLVVGQFKKGKSRLVNALLNAPVSPVDADIATAVPLVIRYGETPAAFLVGSEPARPGAAAERRGVELDRLGPAVGRDADPGTALAEVFLPRQLLADGLCLVDTPGVGGIDAAHTLATVTALPTADAVLVVTDASQEFTEPELQFLTQAQRICPNVACVITKTDLHPGWRRVVELDRAHLDRAGIDVPILPVSSDLRLRAIADADADLNEESGFGALERYLADEVVGQANVVRGRAAMHDLRSVVDQLALAQRAELTSLTDPDAAPRMIAELDAARQRTDDLRRYSARWQITLGDGIQDLVSDVDYDLRDRLRAIIREAETAIDAGDPADVWDDFIDWFEERVAEAVTESMVWTDERSLWLAEEVAAHFTQDEPVTPDLALDGDDDVFGDLDLMPDLARGRLTASQKVLIGARGSYGGVLMIGLLTGVFGMALINPLSVAAGLLIGRKAYLDDKEQRLDKRRAEAKAVVRKQMDEILFQVGKRQKDRLRLVQKRIRDHYTGIAEQYSRSLQDSSTAAQAALTSATRERDQRVTELTARLAELDGMRAIADGARATTKGVAA